MTSFRFVPAEYYFMLFRNLGSRKKQAHNFVTMGKKRNKTTIDLTYKCFVFNCGFIRLYADENDLNKLYQKLGVLGSDGTSDWLGKG